MGKGALGKVYQPGEVITRQGDVGDCMFVIQEGRVQVSIDQDGVVTPLRVAGEGEFVGEMAIFDRCSPIGDASGSWMRSGCSRSTRRTS